MAFNAVKDAINGMVRTRYMSVIAIGTISTALVVLGVFTVLTVFGHGVVERLRGGEEINVYISDELSDEDLLALDTAIRSLPEVAETRLLSKEDAADEFARIFGDDLLAGLEENPLPRTIVVTMAEDARSGGAMKRTAERIEKASGVELVEYGKEWMSRIDIFFYTGVIGEVLLLLLVLSACVLVIANTISLTVMARQETIEIMKLVGATDSYIRRPFALEGMFQGVISGVIAAILLYGALFWAGRWFPDIQVYLMMMRVPGFSMVFQNWMVALLIPIGGMLGLLGSSVAVRRAL